MVNNQSDSNVGVPAWQRSPQSQWWDSPPSGYSHPHPDLLAYLTNHAEKEKALLDEYTSAAKESPSKALSYLIEIVIEDEVRHHRIFAQLAQAVQAKEAQRRDGSSLEGDTAIPSLDLFQLDRSDRDTVLELTGRLLEKEREDSVELKRLLRDMRDVKDATLWSLLVELMEHDTKRHVAILRFVKKHAGRHRH